MEIFNVCLCVCVCVWETRKHFTIQRKYKKITSMTQLKTLEFPSNVFDTSWHMHLWVELKNKCHCSKFRLFFQNVEFVSIVFCVKQATATFIFNFQLWLESLNLYFDFSQNCVNIWIYQLNVFSLCLHLALLLFLWKR